MIGVIGDERTHGKGSFKDLVDYCVSNPPERVAYIGLQNLISAGSAALEMEAVATQNRRCQNPVYHIILSWREMEIPTNAQIDEAVQIALSELDLQDCQALWTVHDDTENRHVHIAVNRIHPETYRAIQPAGNWSHKAIQKVSRKIELLQGWEIEQNGVYNVTADGELVQKEKASTPKLSKSALDMEAHTATQSAQRIGQEIAAPIIRSAKNWRELHAKLAQEGITFEKKGSGAILIIGDTVVKASTAGRNISLSKLCERLGAFEPHDGKIIAVERKPEPVVKVTERKVKSDWERVTEARETYVKEKGEAQNVLAEKHKKERTELFTRQKEERSSLFTDSWKGKGALLNRQRSVTAARQQGEKLDLRDGQKKEMDEFKKKFPRRFPNFKIWLNDKEASSESYLSFRYPKQGAMSGIETTGENPIADLRAFTPVITNKGGVAYKKKDKSEAAFIDYGKKIILSEKTDETAVLAALQLACQKWGGVQLHGSDKYKQMCVELAARHNLKITNPELTKEVEEKRGGIKAQKGQKEQKDMAKADKKSVFNSYADAVGAERYRILVAEFSEERKKAFIFDRKNGGYEGKTREEVMAVMPKLSAFAHYGKNMIVTPLSADKHHILVDDLTPEKLAQLKEDGYSPSCVIESSPENFQAILTVPSLFAEGEKDREAANLLTKELSIKYGDPKLSGAVHGHRLPPFPNCKPNHKREDGSFPTTVLVEAKGGFCEKAGQELESNHAHLIEAKEKARLEMEDRKSSYQSNTGDANDPSGAYWAHYRDIAAKYRGAMDYSRVDAMIGIRMRVTGYTPSEVQRTIEQNAPTMRRESMTHEEFISKYRSRDWNRYAAETTEKYIFGARGAVQYEKALSYRPLYMRLEGRSPLKEQPDGLTPKAEKRERQNKGR